MLTIPKRLGHATYYGHVQLVVALLANGSIKRIEVSKTSGSRLLDQAAVRSVRLASPTSPSPQNFAIATKFILFAPGNINRIMCSPQTNPIHSLSLSL